jgi:divalent metal cation (Fe/Co/Zn/Cd) transporter
MLDPIVALIVALHILVTGWHLARQAIGGLMDEADTGVLAAMAGALEASREPSWIDAHSLRSWRSGAALHVDLHLVVPRYYDADQLHAQGERVENALLGATQRPGEVITHFDPCRPRHCAGCAMDPCPVRTATFAQLRPLTLDRATRSDEALDSGAPVTRVKARE